MVKAFIKLKIYRFFVGVIFLFSIPVQASEQVIPHTVGNFLKLCEDSLSIECQGHVALALDAFETTGLMLHSTGVRTTERSICFKDDDYPKAISQIVEVIRQKAYPSDHMAYAAIIEAAGELFKCDPSGTLIPRNCNTLSKQSYNDNRLSQESEVGDAFDEISEAEYINKKLEDLPQKGVAERYLCSTGKKTFFTQYQNQSNCRLNTLGDGWKNIYFSKDYVFDYYHDGIVKTNNQVKVWSRYFFNSPQQEGRQSNVKYDELKTFMIFRCATRDYKSTEFVYLFDNNEVLRTAGNQTDGMGVIYYDGKINQIEPGSFSEILFKEVCFKERLP